MKKIAFTVIFLFIITSVFSQTATKIQILDTRATNQPPSYYDKEMRMEFKKRSVISVPGSGIYSGLMTIAPWGDNSGDAHHQLCFNEGGIFYRTGQPSTENWDEWSEVLTSGSDLHFDGIYGADLKSGTYPFKATWSYSDNGTGYGPAWIHNNTSTNGTIHPTMFLQSSDNSAHLRVNDALGLGPMSVDLGSYPHIETYTWISGAQGESSYINNGGNLLIGKSTQENSSFRLDVAGIIRADEIRVETSGADFVFADDYNLLTLSELKAFITQNKHLPEIAPAQKMQEEGMAVGELNTKLLQKVEELTLYVIQQNERMDQLSQENQLIKKQNEQLRAQQKELLQLKARIEKLENK
jgi:hypothetical protein